MAEQVLTDREIIEDLTLQKEAALAVRITWTMVEQKEATEKEYRAWRYRYNKITNALIKIEVAIQHEARVKAHEAAVAECTNTHIQLYADQLHETLCTGNHIDYCDYHYGAWANKDNIRTVMIKYYRLAEKMVNTEGETAVRQQIKAMKIAEQTKANIGLYQDEVFRGV